MGRQILPVNYHDREEHVVSIALKYTTDQEADVLAREVERLWNELMANGELVRRAKAAGVKAGALLRRRSDLIRLEEVGVPRHTREMTIIVSIGMEPATDGADTLLPVVTDVWTDIMVPRLRNRFGASAAVQQDEPSSPA